MSRVKLDTGSDLRRSQPCPPWTRASGLQTMGKPQLFTLPGSWDFITTTRKPAQPGADEAEMPADSSSNARLHPERV